MWVGVNMNKINYCGDFFEILVTVGVASVGAPDSY